MQLLPGLVEKRGSIDEEAAAFAVVVFRRFGVVVELAPHDSTGAFMLLSTRGRMTVVPSPTR